MIPRPGTENSCGCNRRMKISNKVASQMTVVLGLVLVVLLAVIFFKRRSAEGFQNTLSPSKSADVSAMVCAIQYYQEQSPKPRLMPLDLGLDPTKESSRKTVQDLINFMNTYDVNKAKQTANKQIVLDGIDKNIIGALNSYRRQLASSKNIVDKPCCTVKSCTPIPPRMPTLRPSPSPAPAPVPKK
jgi:hypothetical protein